MNSLCRCMATTVVWTSVMLSSRGADAASCLSSSSLEALVTCIRDQMPGSGSGGFVPPTTSEEGDFRVVVREMLRGNCTPALGSLASRMQAGTFVDGGKPYCVLHEVLDANGDGKVDKGLGTFIINPNAARELSHQAPHPIADSATELQAIGLFKATDARSFFMAGSHRDAGPDESTCQSDSNEADVPHNTDNLFHAANDELAQFYAANAGVSWTAIQWHGMAESTCSANVYITQGVNVAPKGDLKDKLLQLQNSALAFHPTWKVEVPGKNTCSLNATTNTQGRLLNLVEESQVCDNDASSYTGNFIHVEQDPNFRSPADWKDAVLATWPTQPTALAAPLNLTATAGSRRVTLAWRASAGAMTYTVKRSQTSGGPYTTVASKITTLTYTDTNLQSGRRYFYVVSAAIPPGTESVNSAQVTAVAK